METIRPSSSATNTLAVLTGAFLLIEGIWGLFSTEVFGILTTNTAHAVIHLLLGGTALILGIKHRAKGFCIFLGLLLVIVGLLRFVPGGDEVIVSLLNVNVPVAVLNLILGAVLLATAAYKRPGKLAY